MGSILGAVIGVVAIVGGIRTLKLGVKGINKLFDYFESWF